LVLVDSGQPRKPPLFIASTVIGHPKRHSKTNTNDIEQMNFNWQRLCLL